MKKLLLSAAIISIAALALTAKSKTNDPIVMTVNNKDVTLSEFEYLYNKNNNQQLTPLTFDEYVDMFVNYKLKVAEALDARLDTTASFKSEFKKFRRELAQPYLRDTVCEEKLIRDAYDHTAEDVYVSHIMIASWNENGAEGLDSLRQGILRGEITFEDAARAYSIDRNSSANGGRMGWVTGMGPYPWAFEEAAYNTPIGEISEVVNSGAGYHLIRPEQRRPARGEAKVQHILILTQGLDEEGAAAAKAKIDSIYQVVIQPGVDFGKVAQLESQDPGSAHNGGLLDWFGAGRMVEEFDSVSFALNKGQISEPFKTSYGYHIVHKLDQRGQRPFDEMRPEIESAIESDSRAELPIKSNINKAAEATNSKILPDYRNAVKELIKNNDNQCDTTLIFQVKACTAPAYIANGKTVTLDKALKNVSMRPGYAPNGFIDLVDRAVTNAFDNEMINYEMDQLELNEPSYRNLVNEYRDGILLFDISNQKVWERASKDNEGLSKQFAENRDKYKTWTAPKYKAYVIFANNDSILNEIKDYVYANFEGQKIKDIDQDKFTSAIKDKFKKKVRVERVIAGKGDNPITDYLGYGGEKPETKNTIWPSYFAFAGEVVEQPEEYGDVKGLVVSDYQAKLEQDWIKELRNKYKVKIYNKELKKANK